MFFYGDLDAYVAHIGDYVREGLEADEAVLVATVPSRVDALLDHVGASTVRFVDLQHSLRNPGRLLPLWLDFVAEAAGQGRGARGVGEPLWEGRTPDEIVECQHHEALLNLAFDSGPAWSLLCPYDVSALPEDVLREAMRSHPSVVVSDSRRASHGYLDSERVPGLLAQPLGEPDGDIVHIAFDATNLGLLRERVVESARTSAISAEQVDDLMLVVHELASNSVRHGGGRGLARWWSDSCRFVVEVSDEGHLTDPLAGRTLPPPGAEGGRGLFLVHELSDLVELRTSPAGTVVRVQMAPR